MMLIGRLVSLFAVLFYRDEWRQLDRILRELRGQRIVIPIIAQQMLVLGEDHRFFSHRGIDLIAITRALWRLVAKRSVEGGSTIEQQLVRVLTGRYEKTIGRKIRETCLASLVTSVIPKPEIPGAYLSVAYFGWHMNGAKQACMRLGFDQNHLDITEAAELISRLKYPQPKIFSETRAALIQRRKRYLVALYCRNRPGLPIVPQILDPSHEPV